MPPWSTVKLALPPALYPVPVPWLAGTSSNPWANVVAAVEQFGSAITLLLYISTYKDPYAGLGITSPVVQSI